MKHTDRTLTKKNIRSAGFYCLLLCCAVALFCIASFYISPTEKAAENRNEEGGMGDTEGGTAVLGSGTGDGLGGSAGSGSGEKKGGESGKTAETQESGKKPDEGTKEQNSTPEKKEKAAQTEKKAEGNNSGSDSENGKTPDTPNAKLSLPEPGNEEETADSREKSSFSSGGRSVFKVKKDQNVLFIVDISGSMFYSRTQEGKSCIEVLVIQLKATIQSQKKAKSKGKYAIIAFDDRSYRFPEDQRFSQLLFRSERDYREAEAWIDQLQHRNGGGTALYPALELAIKMIKEKTIKVDMIYLLTDGSPGDNKQEEDYISLLKNLPDKVRINTISIGRNSPLLMKIAKEFKGKYEEYK